MFNICYLKSNNKHLLLLKYIANYHHKINHNNV